MLVQILKRSPEGDGEVEFLIGDDIGMPSLTNCSLVFTRFRSPKTSGYLAVLGPSRMKYQNVIPSLKYTKNLVEEILNS